MPPHPLTNFEIQKYYENESKFNGVYSRNSLRKIKDGAYIINLDEHKSRVFHWISLQANGKIITYLDYFGVENFELKFIGNKNIRTNIYKYKHMIQ